MNSCNPDNKNKRYTQKTPRHREGNRRPTQQKNYFPKKNFERNFSPERITFSIKNEFVSGPTVSIPIISMRGSKHLFPQSLKQFKLVASTNGWDENIKFNSFLLLLDDDLRESTSNARNYMEMLEILYSILFPEADFFTYKNQMDRLKAENFNTVTEYSLQLKRLENLANFTIRGN